MTDYNIIQAMHQYGGSFVRRLAELYQYADDDNRKRLKEAFPEYWTKYSELASLTEKRKEKV